MTQRPDSAIAKDSGGSFEPHSEGQFAMLCVDVVNLGTKVEQYLNFEPKAVEKVAIVFASGEKHEAGLAIVTVEMTLSMSEKANLRKFLESWRGKSYTAEQAEEGVPLHKLHGHPALTSIEHIKTKRGNTFAKVRSIGPLPKAMTPPSSDLLDEYERPNFFDDKKRQYAEDLARFRHTTDDEPPAPDDEYADEDPDALPF